MSLGRKRRGVKKKKRDLRKGNPFAGQRGDHGVKSVAAASSETETTLVTRGSTVMHKVPQFGSKRGRFERKKGSFEVSKL